MSIDLFTPQLKPKDDQQIKVVIYVKDVVSASHILSNLDRNSTLEDTRKLLSQIKEVFVGWQNTFFLKGFRRIHHSYEDTCRVEDILVQEPEVYSLHIEKDESIPCVPELVHLLKIDRGLRKLDNNMIIIANMPAFYIKDLHMKEIIIQNKLESYCQKGSILLSYKELEATNEYIDAIKDALNEDYTDIQKVAKLKEIGNEVQEIKLGGKSLDDKHTNFRIIGGNVNDMIEDTSKWIKSLEFYKTWAIIEYGDKFSLYELLSEDLQLKIRQLIGMRNYKIFASTFNKENKDPFKNVFSIRIDYQNDKSPYFVIHRIGKVPSNHPQIDLLISWIVIGHEKNFPIQPIPNNTGLEYIWTKDHKNAEIKLHRPIPYDYCLIGTCVLRCDQNPSYLFGQSGTIISYHFCQSNDEVSIKTCCNQNNIHNIKETLDFEINCTVLSKNNSGGLRPSIINAPSIQVWKRPKWMPFASGSLFIGNEWELPYNDLVFASLVYLHSSGDTCTHFFLNINQKYPTIKSLDNAGNPDCQVSYIAF
ncbi:24207_t:CDS:2 [Dentiscutata erythropus]|uniref:24207_t:CDS:1 n=1 Tax=Dentiscutata erythropus TaxID=1348616 RepID=A0A9N9F667_9GLOM|nr:24207_t:CDS:2 [Dentiscutata erythropus]